MQTKIFLPAPPLLLQNCRSQSEETPKKTSRLCYHRAEDILFSGRKAAHSEPAIDIWGLTLYPEKNCAFALARMSRK
jgi:hypothetical protein